MEGRGEITRVRERRARKREGVREKKESYIQNSRDKAELSDLAVTMVGIVRAIAKLYVEETGSGKVGYRV